MQYILYFAWEDQRKQQWFISHKESMRYIISNFIEWENKIWEVNFANWFVYASLCLVTKLYSTLCTLCILVSVHKYRWHIFFLQAGSDISYLSHYIKHIHI